MTFHMFTFVSLHVFNFNFSCILAILGLEIFSIELLIFTTFLLMAQIISANL